MPYLDSICIVPLLRGMCRPGVERHRWLCPRGCETCSALAASVQVPRLTAAPRVAEDLGVQQARPPTPGHGGGLRTDELSKCTRAPSAAVPALGAGSGTRYQARGW